MLPPDLTILQFIGQVSFDKERKAILRLDDCVRCSMGQALCRGVKPDVHFEEGMKPVWGVEPISPLATILLQKCSRHSNTVMTEQLVSWGFPKEPAKGISVSYHRNTDTCANFVRRFLPWCARPNSIALVSPIKSAKTIIATGLVRQALIQRSIRTARCWDVATMLAELRRFDKEHKVDTIVEEAKEADVLVLDHLDTVKSTEFAREQFHVIVQYRCYRGSPIVVTARREIMSYASSIGERAAELLFEACGEGICPPVEP